MELKGTETYDITGISVGVTPRMDIPCKITYADGSTKNVALLCRIDTADEVDYSCHGGILQYVLRGILKAA